MTLSDTLQIVTSLSSISAVLVVAWQVRESRRIAVIQNTLNGIDTRFRMELETVIDRELNAFLGSRAWDAVVSEESASQILASTTASNAVWDYLNWWERVAIGIHMGGFDREMCRRRFGRLLIRAYRRLEPIVVMRRINTRNSEVYSDLERLVGEWSAELDYRPFAQ